jgi:hypothetical protein
VRETATSVSSRPVAAARRTLSQSELLRRSGATVADALDQIIQVDQELRSVVQIAAERPWSDEERERYRAVARREREIHRRFTAAGHWFDDILARHDQHLS